MPDSLLTTLDIQRPTTYQVYNRKALIATSLQHASNSIYNPNPRSLEQTLSGLHAFIDEQKELIKEADKKTYRYANNSSIQGSLRVGSNFKTTKNTTIPIEDFSD